MGICGLVRPLPEAGAFLLSSSILQAFWEAPDYPNRFIVQSP
jgi:hypothetical protein